MFSQAQFDKDLHIGEPDLPCKIFVRSNGQLLTRVNYSNPTAWGTGWKHIKGENLKCRGLCSSGFFHFYRNPLQLLLNVTQHVSFYEKQYEIWTVETKNETHEVAKSGCRSMRLVKELYIPRFYFYRVVVWLAQIKKCDYIPSYVKDGTRYTGLHSLYLNSSVYRESSLPNLENDLREFFKAHNLTEAFGQPKSFFID